MKFQNKMFTSPRKGSGSTMVNKITPPMAALVTVLLLCSTSKSPLLATALVIPSGLRIHHDYLPSSTPKSTRASSPVMMVLSNHGKTSSTTSLEFTSSGSNGSNGRNDLTLIRESRAENGGAGNGNGKKQQQRRRKKYTRKKEKPSTEKETDRLRKLRQTQYEELRNSNNDGYAPSIWSFESLFPGPVWDEKAVREDLYGVAKRDGSIRSKKEKMGIKSEYLEPKLASDLPYDSLLTDGTPSKPPMQKGAAARKTNGKEEKQSAKKAKVVANKAPAAANTTEVSSSNVTTIDRTLTRKVEERIYGYRRTPQGDFYDTSLNKEGAVEFRDGRRVGNALGVNCDRLNYFAKKEIRKNRLEEAQELYEQAIDMNPRDGRAYLGLARVAERRRDFKRAKECLKAGIANSDSRGVDEFSRDKGSNPFLLQALGVHEEKMGHLTVAEALYMEAVKSRPSHAAAWVSLAQLRTRKLRQGAPAGRSCYQSAERELKRAGQKPSSYVYTAWATMEYQMAGNAKRARELFKAALEIDPKCSVAWLQLGLLESARGDYDLTEKCYETVLKFDNRNSRVLQAYAIMETKRPNGDSRKAIGLFERALKVNPRDAGVLQPYALYCAELGDIDMARELLKRGTEVNKRHAPVWQAWGVLETRYGKAEVARDIFQQGIWACAQLGGGQSGGYHCARLWQAWGVLEAREADYAAARRCFNRALDADNRNVATITAWTLMEEDLGNFDDARHIFERSLKQFPSSSNEKISLWRSYEQMEQHAGKLDAAQEVYRRSMAESFALSDAQQKDIMESDAKEQQQVELSKTKLKESKENITNTDVEVSRWDTSSMRGEIWLNDGSIEGKVPASSLKKKNSPKSYEGSVNGGSVEGKVPASSLKKKNSPKSYEGSVNGDSVEGKIPSSSLKKKESVNGGSVEGKVPASSLKKKNSPKSYEGSVNGDSVEGKVPASSEKKKNSQKSYKSDAS